MTKGKIFIILQNKKCIEFIIFIFQTYANIGNKPDKLCSNNKKNRKPTYKKRLFDFEMMSDFNAHITSQNIMWQKTSTKLIVLTTRETKETKDC